MSANLGSTPPREAVLYRVWEQCTRCAEQPWEADTELVRLLLRLLAACEPSSPHVDFATLRLRQALNDAALPAISEAFGTAAAALFRDATAHGLIDE